MTARGRSLAAGWLGLALTLVGCDDPAAIDPPVAAASAPAAQDAGSPPSSEAASVVANSSASQGHAGDSSASAPALPATGEPQATAASAAATAESSAAAPAPTAPPTAPGVLASATAPATPAAPTPPPRKRATRRGEAAEISFDDIKFEMIKGDPFLRTMLTPAIEALAGQRVRIRGYMLPSFQQTGLKQFVLVRDNMQCCFGPGAALFDCVVINMAEGRSAEYSFRPVAVEGTFQIHELLGPDGKHLAIYEMAGESVR